MERKEFLLTGVMAGIAATGLAGSTSNPIANDNGPLKPFYIPPFNEPLLPIHGLDIRTNVRSSQTNNQYSCIDAAVAPKTMGPPPHLHKDLDELMYVKEGTINVLVGTEVYEVKAGGWHFRPRGIVHTFWNATDKPALCTDMYFNQNFEDYLEELFFKIYPDMMKRNLTPADPEIAKQIGVLDKKFGIVMFPEQRQAIVDKYGLKN
ncbi:MAG TPA: cupin domain-containing protein [Cyclobacteriaceae bacterium]